MGTTSRVAVMACVVAMVVLPLNAAYGQRGGRGGGGGGGGGGGQRNNGGGGGQQPARPDPNLDPTVVADKLEVTKIQTELNGVIKQADEARKKVVTDFEKSDEYAAAIKALEAASRAVDEARAAVLVKLKTQADYKAAVAKEDAAKAKLKKLKDDGAMRAEQDKQNQEILALGGVTNKIERDALAADGPYGEAMAKLGEANSVVKGLRAKLDEQIKGDASLTELTAKRTETQGRLTAAQKKYSTDLTAASSR